MLFKCKIDFKGTGKREANIIYSSSLVIPRSYLSKSTEDDICLFGRIKR